jgi:hypothetical protein
LNLLILEYQENELSCEGCIETECGVCEKGRDRFRLPKEKELFLLRELKKRAIERLQKEIENIEEELATFKKS